MKIVIASSGLGHVARGIEAWAGDLGRALAERGVAARLCKGGGREEAAHERVIPCWNRESQETRRLLGWLPARLTWRLGLASGYGVEQTTFALALIRHLRRERADLLHVQDPHVALLVQRARRLGWLGTRTILAHGTEEPLSFLRKMNYVQHLAPWHLEQARAAGARDPAWTAIPNFIDTSLFRPGSGKGLRAELGIPPEGLVLLTVAAIKRQHKRIDWLLHEFARLRHTCPDLPVWLVVAGGWETDTDELVAHGKQALGDRVRFLVRFPRSRMPELYRSADAFVLCSLKEMMPIAVLEAAASGLPCLVNRHPVLQWMTGPGGEAIDMREEGLLASTIARLLRDRHIRQRLGGLARQHCVEHFSRDRVLDQILEYYRFVLDHGRRAA